MRIDPTRPNLRTVADRISHWSAVRDNARSVGDTDLERTARRELAAANAEDCATQDYDTVEDIAEAPETGDADLDEFHGSQWSRG